MLIVLIEDDLGTIDLVKKYLKKFDCDIIVAEEAGKAIEIIELKNPDLFILDYSLPDMTGIEFLQALNENHIPIPPFIVTTGRGDEKLAVEMMKLGAKDYLVKDIHFWNLFPQIVKRILEEIENDNKRIAAEKALHKIEKLAARAQEIAKLGGWELDVVNNILYWTVEAYNIFEVPVGTQLTYESFLELVHPDDRNIVDTEWKKALKTKHYDIEHRLQVNGKVKWVREKADLEFDDNGKCLFAVGITQDISSRIEVENSLAESEKKHRLLFENSGLGIGYFTVDGRIVAFNKVAAENMGGKPEDYKGKTLIEVHGKELGQVYKERILAAANETEILSFEDLIQTKNGSRWFLSNISRICGDNGQVLGVQIISNDITLRKQTEETLKKLVDITSINYGEKLFEAIVSELCNLFNVEYAFIGMICEEDQEYIKTIALAENCKIIENIKYNSIGTPCQNVIAGSVCAYCSDVINKFPEDKLLVELGVEGYVGVPLFDNNDNLLGNIAIMSKSKIKDSLFQKTILQIISTRITSEIQHLQSEKELKEREMLLRETQRISKVGGWQIDINSRKMIWTAETYRIFEADQLNSDINSDDFIESLSKCFNSADNLILREAGKRCVEFQDEFDLEFTVSTLKNRKIWIRISAKPVIENRRVVRVIGNVMDISELKSMRSQLDKFFEQPMNLHIIAGLDGIIYRINRGWYNALGYTKTDLVGKLFLDFIHPDDIEATKREMASLAEGKTTFYFENRYRHKNGEYKTLAWSSIVEENEKLIYAVATDITERKILDSINLSRLHLLQFVTDHSLDELLTETLNEVERLTNSKIGFYHFVDKDEKALKLQAWSTNTKKIFCDIQIEDRHYPFEKAGVWAECFYTKTPVIHNDYEKLKNKKGLPEGHAKVNRELVVPILRADKVVAILGVGNKESSYTNKDVELVSILADLAWEVTERKKAEEEIKILNLAIEQSPVSTIITDTDGNIQYVNKHFYKLTGYTENEVLGKNPRVLASGNHTKEFYQNLWENILSGKTWEGEFQNRKKDGNLFWEKAIISPVINDIGEIISFLAVKEDITEKKESEKQLFEKIAKLEKFNKVMVDRELKMVELKKEVNSLLKEVGREKKYLTKQ